MKQFKLSFWIRYSALQIHPELQGLKYEHGERPEKDS